MEKSKPNKLFNSNLETIDEEFSKVLIINPYPISANCPIGIMMESLFEGYVPSNIMQFYTHTCEINKNSKFKAEQITLNSPFSIKLKNLVKRLVRKKSERNINTFRNQDVVLRNTGVRDTILQAWLYFWLPCYLDKKMIRNIKEFNPSIIYTQGYSYTMLKYVNKLSKKLKCPVVIHTLDDWMETQYKNGILSAIPFCAFNNLFKHMLNNGRKHMVASPKMEKYMGDKYGGNYNFVMNCCEYPTYKKREKQQIMKVVYTGGLMLERYLILDEIAKTINLLNRKEKGFELHIYTPLSHVEAYKDLMQPEIVFHYNVEHKEIINVLTESDVLVHTESYNPNVIRFTEYSLSTKVPEYLAAGRPLIYFGPTNIGVGEFLSENKIGIRVSNVNELKEELESLYQDEGYYDKVAFEDYCKGKAIFDTEIMRNRMNKCLQNRSEL